MDLRCADYRAGTVKEKKIARRIRLARIVKTEKIFLTKTLSSDAISGEKIFPAMKFVGGNFFHMFKLCRKIRAAWEMKGNHYYPTLSLCKIF